MCKKVFLDANILVDFMDDTRRFHQHSVEVIRYCLTNDIALYTSCDIVTTIYYVSAKSNRFRALNEIEQINKFCHVVDFSNPEVRETCVLMREDSDFKDLEDTIQYILAKKAECDLIVTNDMKFVAKDIVKIGSEAFCKKINPPTS